MKREILVAHSPDADDIFMYMAIKFGWISNKNFNFKNEAHDIETLNKQALNSQFDATAISFALYPKIYEDYALLRTAVSFGEGYGPKIIKKKNKTLKKNFKVALSGANTTNAMIFRIAYPEARIVYKNFLDIENAVLQDEVDAGVLIHESILNFCDELCVEREIWDIWQELNKQNLPLPLGGMAIRRSLPLTSAIEIENTLTKAVSIATKNKKLLSKMLIERNLVRVDDKKLEKYLNLYANENSIQMNETQLKAVEKLFEIGYNAGFYGDLIKVKDNLIPIEYNEIRFC